MNECRHAHAMTAADRRVFALGGLQHIEDNISYLASCEYLPHNNNRQFFGIFLCFCYNKLKIAFSMHLPPLLPLRWMPFPDMNRRRYKSAAIWVPQYGVFCIGGYSDESQEEDSVEYIKLYEFGPQQPWRLIKPMLNPVSWPIVAQINKCIFVLDGHSSSYQIQMIDVRSIPDEQWTIINHNNPFDDLFEPLSMTARNDCLLLSSLSHSHF